MGTLDSNSIPYEETIRNLGESHALSRRSAFYLSVFGAGNLVLSPLLGANTKYALSNPEVYVSQAINNLDNTATDVIKTISGAEEAFAYSYINTNQSDPNARALIKCYENGRMYIVGGDPHCSDNPNANYYHTVAGIMTATMDFQISVNGGPFRTGSIAYLPEGDDEIWSLGVIVGHKRYTDEQLGDLRAWCKATGHDGAVDRGCVATYGGAWDGKWSTFGSADDSFTCKTWVNTYNGAGTYTGGNYVLVQQFYPRVRIIYNCEGGSNGPSDTYKWYGIESYISSVKPTRIGYDYLGWTTKLTSNEPNIASNQLLGLLDWNCNAHQSYRAIAWDAYGNITVRYDWNPGCLLPSKDEGHDSTGNQITLHACWSPHHYKIHYEPYDNRNGSTELQEYTKGEIHVGGTTKDSEHTYDVASPLTANGFWRQTWIHYYPHTDGLTILHEEDKYAHLFTIEPDEAYPNYYISDSGRWQFTTWLPSFTAPKPYNDKESVVNLTSKDGATLTMYAQWSLPQHDLIRYGYNQEKIRVYGYNFKGWALYIVHYDNAGKRTHRTYWQTLQPAASISLKHDVEADAVWERIPISVEYYRDGELLASDTAYLVEPYTPPTYFADDATRENCSGFYGWYTAPNYKNLYEPQLLTGNTKLYGYNKCSIEWDTIISSREFLNNHTWYSDEACTTPVNPYSLYPATDYLPWGASWRSNFDSEVAIYTLDMGKVRCATIGNSLYRESQANTKIDKASGFFTIPKVTENTVVYAEWKWATGSYDGVTSGRLD